VLGFLEPYSALGPQKTALIAQKCVEKVMANSASKTSVPPARYFVERRLDKIKKMVESYAKIHS